MSSSLQMKNCRFKPFLFSWSLRSFALATACILGIPFVAKADDYNNQNDHQESSRRVYPWQVVSGFLVSAGNDITSHVRRVVVRNPSYQYRQGGARYDGQDNPRSNSMETSVQLALKRSGYYNGPIDGRIGPMSQRAISNYQADRGFRVTGYPDNTLLNSLGLQ